MAKQKLHSTVTEILGQLKAGKGTIPDAALKVLVKKLRAHTDKKEIGTQLIAVATKMAQAKVLKSAGQLLALAIALLGKGAAEQVFEKKEPAKRGRQRLHQVFNRRRRWVLWVGNRRRSSEYGSPASPTD